ncbi:hypothetical protein [Aeromicrobium sp. Leaf291]|uniref:hypothetical protein n=1 Tax=Aeromicrobium sp. Leaf291 TaxID=1736325 RepID=UPI000AEA5750|nr:hypothetical protein [Aeromicrobium sp. Leaf291]
MRTVSRALTLILVGGVVAALLVPSSASARVSMTKAKVEQWLASTCTTFETQAAFKTRTARLPNKMLNADGYDVTRFTKYNVYTSDSYRLNACLSLIEKANSFSGNRKNRTITFAPGTFKLSNAIFVPSDTTVVLSSGTTINKLMTTGISGVRASSSMFQTISPTRALRSNAVKGYDGERNITFRGPGDGSATINMMGTVHPAFDKVYGVVIGHASNVRVEGIRFRNNHLGHFLEVSASQDTVVKGNDFVNDVRGDGKAGTKANPNAEAINVDTPDSRTKGVNYTWGAMDRYGNNRLTIEDNDFLYQNRAVGTHVMSAVARVTTPRKQEDWSLRYHTAVVLKNNRIVDSRFDAVKMLNWRSPVLEGNLIDGITTRRNASNNLPATAVISQGAENPTIRNNRFVDVPEPMLVRTYDSPHYSFTNARGVTEKLRSINTYPTQGTLQAHWCSNQAQGPADRVALFSAGKDAATAERILAKEPWRRLTVYKNTYRSGSSVGQIVSEVLMPWRSSASASIDTPSECSTR